MSKYVCNSVDKPHSCKESLGVEACTRRALGGASIGESVLNLCHLKRNPQAALLSKNRPAHLWAVSVLLSLSEEVLVSHAKEPEREQILSFK
jgi:hypothetical protein